MRCVARARAVLAEGVSDVVWQAAGVVGRLAMVPVVNTDAAGYPVTVAVATDR